LHLKFWETRRKSPAIWPGFNKLQGLSCGDWHPCTQQREYIMKNFAQRDFVNSTVYQTKTPQESGAANVFRQAVTLVLSTLGIIFSLYFVYLAH